MKIFIPKPKRDVENGIIVEYDKDTKENTNRAFADIVKGQTGYDLPEEERKIKSITIIN